MVIPNRSTPQIASRHRVRRLRRRSHEAATRIRGDRPANICFHAAAARWVSDLLGVRHSLLPQSPDAADLVLPSKLSGMLRAPAGIATCRPETEISEIVSKCGWSWRRKTAKSCTGDY